MTNNSYNNSHIIPEPTLLKKRPWHRCFPVNFARVLRTPFIIEHLWWLLLYLAHKLRNSETYSLFCSNILKCIGHSRIVFATVKVSLLKIYYQVSPRSESFART